jgi:hypothetical protein
MVAAIIRAKISAAVTAEAESGQLRRCLEQQLPLLRSKLVLPEQEPVAALLRFITDYIESVPGCLQLVTAVSKQMGFYAYAAPFLDMAQDYFLQPPPELPPDNGLEGLLDEAFLAHRLLEEVNDHHIRHLRRPLLPVDMTETNVIVHHLLGDALANTLDQKVNRTATQLLGREYVWTRVPAQPEAAVPMGIPLRHNPLSGPPHRIRLRLAGEAG